jgi:biotin synthase-related radical SAM superfamily protein
LIKVIVLKTVRKTNTSAASIERGRHVIEAVVTKIANERIGAGLNMSVTPNGEYGQVGPVSSG